MAGLRRPPVPQFPLSPDQLAAHALAAGRPPQPPPGPIPPVVLTAGPAQVQRTLAVADMVPVDHSVDVTALIASLRSPVDTAAEAYEQLTNQLAAEVENLVRQRIEVIDPGWKDAIRAVAQTINENCPETEIQDRLSQCRSAPDGMMARFLIRKLAAALPEVWGAGDRYKVAQAMVRRARTVPLSDLYRSLQPPPVPTSTESNPDAGDIELPVLPPA